MFRSTKQPEKLPRSLSSPHAKSSIVRCALCALLVALTIIYRPAHLYAEDQAAENVIKAAFVYKFAKFVEWPSGVATNEDASIVICVWGADALGGALSSLNGKFVRNRPIAVRYLLAGRMVIGCHILFVGPNGSIRHLRKNRILNPRNLLTVGESPDFASEGGVVRLFIENNRVRFEINVDAAAAANLKISSKLLGLARIVRRSN